MFLSFWRVFAFVLTGLFLLLVLASVFVINPYINQWVDSGQLNDLLNREASKGLHLQAQASPLHRVGMFSMQIDSFQGSGGARTIQALSNSQITGTFNPWGIFLRRWEIDNVQVASGTVTLQKVDATPEEIIARQKAEEEARRNRPWYTIFLPDRVYFQHVHVASSDALWQMNGKAAGLFGAVLDITPNQRDFEYEAHGGELRMAPLPNLPLQHLHMLIRKPLLTLYDMVLTPDPTHSEQNIRLSGTAGLQIDRSISATADWTQLDLAPWLPEKLRTEITGQAFGHLEYHSTGTGLETSSGQGSARIENGMLHHLGIISRYCRITESPDPGDLPLSVCSTDVVADKGVVTFKNLQAEGLGVFRVEGTVIVGVDKSLSGQVWVGFAPAYLKWMPTAQQKIFTEKRGDYAMALVQLSGTLQHPKEDLSPRLITELEKDPILALKMIFRAGSDWLDWD